MIHRFGYIYGLLDFKDFKSFFISFSFLIDLQMLMEVSIIYSNSKG